MATHSSTLAWRIPWTEEPGGLQSMGSQSWTRLSDSLSLSLSHTHTHTQPIETVNHIHKQDKAGACLKGFVQGRELGKASLRRWHLEGIRQRSRQWTQWVTGLETEPAWTFEEKTREHVSRIIRWQMIGEGIREGFRSQIICSLVEACEGNVQHGNYS